MGNPYLKILREEFSEEFFREAAKRHVVDVLAGDEKSRQLAYRYLIPNPNAIAREIRGELVDQIRQVRDELAAGGVDAATANVLGRLLAIEAALGQSGVDGKKLTLSEVDKILNSEVEL
jgi:hypothetical protein